MSIENAASVCYIIKDAAFAAGDKLTAHAQRQETHQALLDKLLTSWFGGLSGDVMLWTDGLVKPMLARRDGDGYTVTAYEGNTSGYDGPCLVAGGTDGTGIERGLFSTCVAIAYLDGWHLQAAVVYDPVHVELFHAVAGLGAYLNGTRITPSSVKRLSNAHVFVGQAALRKSGGPVQTVIMEAGHILAGAACALELCHTACGRTDAVVVSNEAFIDYTAGLLIAREAGVVLMDGSGERLHELREYGERRDITAACPGIAGELLGLLSDN